MTTHIYAMVRGRVARFTRLNPCGDVAYGDSAYVVSSGISSIAVTEEKDSISTEALRSDTGPVRIVFPGQDDVLGYTADVTLIEVDPAVVTLLTGQPVVLDADGDPVGFDVEVGLPASNFAIEVWSRIANRCEGGKYRYGYTIFPRLRGGRIGGITFENGLANITVLGARTTRIPKWSRGPYGSAWDTHPWDTHPWDGRSDDSLTEIGPNTHWRQRLIDYAPDPTKGFRELIAPG